MKLASPFLRPREKEALELRGRCFIVCSRPTIFESRKSEPGKCEGSHSGPMSVMSAHGADMSMSASSPSSVVDCDGLETWLEIDSSVTSSTSYSSSSDSLSSVNPHSVPVGVDIGNTT